jgi:hypothetical protein
LLRNLTLEIGDGLCGRIHQLLRLSYIKRR